MSTLFSHFFTKFNQISPLEANFTEVLSTIALVPKTLYFYGKLPQNVAKSPKKESTGARHKGPKISPQQAEFDLSAPSVAKPAQPRTVRPKTVAIVGSRHSTRYGEEIAYDLAYKLAKRGVVVVSGLAYGIDSVGHRGALDAGGTTVAVLGTPIDRIYPKSHLGLAAGIIKQGGAIISEYAPRSPEYLAAPLAPAEAGWDGRQWINAETERRAEEGFPNAQSSATVIASHGPFVRRNINQHSAFLYRNRIIAGLSDIVVVVEAAEQSGSLNTASHALAQGKDVFAVPGNITSPYSRGCNKLIRQGAFPYTEPSDILRLLFPDDYIRIPTHAGRKLIGDTDVETLILRALASGLRSGDDIMRAATLPSEVFNQAITLLEIKGRIRPLGANNWGLM